MSDPYAGVEKSTENKKPPKQTADDGPINAVFTADEETEEYFLFVRKVKTGIEDNDTSPESATGAAGAEEEPQGVVGLGMRGPNKKGSMVAPEGKSKFVGVWLPLGDIVVEAGGNMDVVVAERRKILTRFAKRKHLKMLPIAADEKLEFGLRVQRAPSRGTDPSEVFPVATASPHAELMWNCREMGELGTQRAELRLMNTMPSISSHKKNEMLSSAMGMIKAQQEKAAALAAEKKGEGA